MKKQTLAIIFPIMLIFLLSSCGCEHKWVDADCDTPKTCSICEETEGGPLGHIWVDATCETAKTCSVCQSTVGNPHGHTPGEIVTTSDYVQALEFYTQSCTVCGDLLEESSTTISLIGNDTYLFTAQEFVDRINHILTANGNSDFHADLIVWSEDNQSAVYAVIDYMENPLIIIDIYVSEIDPSTTYLWAGLTEEDMSTPCIKVILAHFTYHEDGEDIEEDTIMNVSLYKDPLAAIIMACSSCSNYEDTTASVTENLLKILTPDENGIYSDFTSNLPYDEVYVEYANFYANPIMRDHYGISESYAMQMIIFMSKADYQREE